MTLNPLLPFVAILAPAWDGVVGDDVAWLATMLFHAMLCIASGGLESALASQGNLSLHDAAISEPIF